MKKILVSLLSFIFILFIPFLYSGQQLTILHTNDTHSHLFPFGPRDGYGGIARMSTMIKKLKAKHQNVLTVNSGDVFVGTFAFNKYLGYPELKMMESLYDAMCLGNHEFDLGLDPLAGILSGAISGGSPVTLPILCANVNFPTNHPLGLMVQRSMSFSVGSIKVGLIGVVTTDQFNYSTEIFALLTDPYATAEAEAQTLKSGGCDVVICLSHLGKNPDQAFAVNAPSVDIVIGGHSHDIVEAVPSTRPIIVQAGEYGKYLGELTVDIGTNSVTLINHTIYPIDKEVRRDPKLLGTLNNLRDGIYEDPRFGPIYSKHVAKAIWDHEERWQPGNPHRDTPLGNLIADAIKKSVAELGVLHVDCALEANGHIGHKIYAGKVVGNDVLRTVPYGYDAVSGLGFKIEVVALAGIEILLGLEYTVHMAHTDSDDVAVQVSGLEFEYDSRNPPFNPNNPQLSRIDPFSVMIDGENVYPSNLYKIYFVATSDRLIQFIKDLLGLDLTGRVFPTGLFEYNVVRDYMMKLNHLKYTSEGRIVDTALQ